MESVKKKRHFENPYIINAIRMRKLDNPSSIYVSKDEIIKRMRKIYKTKLQLLKKGGVGGGEDRQSS